MEAAAKEHDGVRLGLHLLPCCTCNLTIRVLCSQTNAILHVSFYFYHVIRDKFLSRRL